MQCSKTRRVFCVPQMKRYKFDLQKAVNTPVNAIAPTSGQHLRDKLQRICTLLSGQATDVGNKKVSSRDHPSGTLFCKNLFAAKIVVSTRMDTMDS